MLYLNERVPIPEKSTYTRGTEPNVYLYLRVGSFYNEKHQQRHRQYAIGKLVTDADGERRLIPNDNYYKYFNLPKPVGGEVKKSGPQKRKTAAETDAKAGSYQKAGSAQKRAPMPQKLLYPEESFPAYGHAVLGLMQECGIFEILEELWGRKRTLRAAAIIAFYVQSEGRADLSKFFYFAEDQMADIVKPFDARRVLEDFAYCDRNFVQIFERRWIAQNVQKAGKAQKAANEDLLLYDVSSLSTTDAGLDSAFNPVLSRQHGNPDDLEEQNFALVCTANGRIPLFLATYYDSINDAANLSEVKDKCRELGLNEDFEIISDLCSADAAQPDFSVLKGRGLMTACPRSLNPEVYQAVLGQAALLAQNKGESFKLDGLYPLACSRTAFTLCNVKGSLLVILDNERRINEMRRVMSKREFKNKNWQALAADRSLGEQVLLAGISAFFSSRKCQDSCQLIQDYGAKGTVSMMLDGLKNDLVDGRNLVHSGAVLEGKMFYLFLSLIVYREFERRCSGIFSGPDKVTVSLLYCFLELQHMHLIKNGGTMQPVRLNNPVQQRVFEALFTNRDLAQGPDKAKSSQR